MQYIINVCTTSGNVQEFKFLSTTYISEMKTEIYANHRGIIKTNHNSTHHLIYRGQPLEETHTLGEYTIPAYSKVYFMSKSTPLEISSSFKPSSLDEYIISPQTNSPNLTNSGFNYMESRLHNDVENKNVQLEILLEMRQMMRDIHDKIMNSKNI